LLFVETKTEEAYGKMNAFCRESVVEFGNCFKKTGRKYVPVEREPGNCYNNNDSEAGGTGPMDWQVDRARIS
jgi:hypothetical protein